MNISRFIKFMLQWGSKGGTQTSKEDYIPARDKWSPFSIFTSGTWKLSTNKSSNRSKATASCTSNPSRNADTKSAPFWSELALVVCGDVLSSTDLVRVLNRTCSLRNSTNGVSILSQFSLNGVSLLYLVPETSEIASAATAGNWEGLKSSFESIIWRGSGNWAPRGLKGFPVVLESAKIASLGSNVGLEASLVICCVEKRETSSNSSERFKPLLKLDGPPLRSPGKPKRDPQFPAAT